MSKQSKNQNPQDPAIIATYIKLLIHNSTPDEQKDFELIRNSPVFTLYLKKLLIGKSLRPYTDVSLKIFENIKMVKIEAFEPSGPNITDTVTILVDTNTIVNISNNTPSIHSDNVLESYLSYGNHRQKLDQIININLLNVQKPVFPLKGILVTSEKGNGRTTLLRHLNDFYKGLVETILIKPKELDSVTDTIIKSSGSILLLISDIDADNKPLLNKLSNFMITHKEHNLLVIATTLSDKLNELNSIKGSYLFEKIIDIPLPNKTERISIIEELTRRISEHYTREESLAKELQTKLTISDTKCETLIDDLMIESIALKTSGFTMQDLVNLFREIELAINPGNPYISPQIISSAFENSKLANLQSITESVAKLHYDDIGGYEDVKTRIRSVVELPLKRPEIFIKKGITPSKGILLYGPPGCSKTMFARAIATESNFNFISVKGPEVFNKYVGSSEKRIRDLFRKAKFCAPSIIFFDEIDAIASKRDKKTDVGERILTQLLTEMDGAFNIINSLNKPDDISKTHSKDYDISKKSKSFADNMVVVIAATNRPDVLDPAILRPGRFDELIYVPLPDRTAVKKITELNTKNMDTDSDISVDLLTDRLIGYSGAEIVQVCREAAMQSIYSGDVDRQINMNDFSNAMNRVKKRIDRTILQRFETFEKNEFKFV